MKPAVRDFLLAAPPVGALDPEHRDELLVFLDESGCRHRVVDLGHTRDKAALLAVLAGALEFPEYFGHNWDALVDCLGEFFGRDRACVLVLDRVDELASRERRLFLDLVGALEDGAERASGEDAWPARVFLVGRELGPDLTSVAPPR